MEPVALTLIAVFVFAAFLLLRPTQFAPALAFEGRAETELPGDEDDQMPETDRAPRRRNPLAWTVAALALVRVTLLIALGA
jgi:hypothetical protein